jgi:hypothetical protein
MYSQFYYRNYLHNNQTHIKPLWHGRSFKVRFLSTSQTHLCILAFRHVLSIPTDAPVFYKKHMLDWNIWNYWYSANLSVQKHQFLYSTCYWILWWKTVAPFFVPPYFNCTHQEQPLFIVSLGSSNVTSIVLTICWKSVRLGSNRLKAMLQVRVRVCYLFCLI